MVKLKNTLYLATTLLSLLATFGCKSTPVDEVLLTKSKFLGQWRLTTRITDTLVNGKSKNKPDTIKFTAIDTLQFLPNDTLIIGNTKTLYSFDEKAENVTYQTTPPATWHIEYLRIKSIILTNRRTENIGNDAYTYYTEEQLEK